MTELRVVVADDEPMALAKLRRLLSQERDVVIVAECRDGASAAHAIATLAPDVVFLDVEMPERTGFEALARGRAGTRPVVVFVTAFENYAVRAFDVRAADFLLKPFGAERLRKALDCARERIRADGACIEAAESPSARPAEWRGDRLVFQSGGGVVILPLDDVEWFESMGNYVAVHTRSSRVLMRETMCALAGRLPGDTFVRIHRGAIVNANYVREVRPNARLARVVTLASGTRLRVSRMYRRALAHTFTDP